MSSLPRKRSALFRFRVFFCTRMGAPSPTGATSFLVGAKTHSSTSYGVSFSPRSTRHQRPTNHHRHGQKRETSPDTCPSRHCQSHAHRGQPSLRIYGCLPPAIRILPRPSHEASRTLPPTPLLTTRAPSPRHSTHRDDDVHRNDAPTPRQSANYSYTVCTPNAP